jgi:circadian clock protein KaiB
MVERKEDGHDDAAAALSRSAAFRGPFRLRLFIAGNSLHSQRAVRNLRRICERHLDPRTRVEVIDIHQDREEACREGILGVPTLIKTEPGPLRRLIGDLADERKVIAALGVAPAGV